MHHLMIDDQFSRMPWDEIDAVVFDVGQVLLRFEPDAIMRQLLPDCPELYPRLKDIVFRSPYWVTMDRGMMDGEELAAAMASSHPDLAEPIRHIVVSWQHLPAIPEGVAALHACKAHGKRVYGLTNYSRQAFAVARADHDFFHLFDDILVSSHHLLVKPDPAIYRLAEAMFSLDPARTLFIDDSPANIEAALHCGWQGLCFNAPGKLEKFFA